jgi:hypothetical protein
VTVFKVSKDAFYNLFVRFLGLLVPGLNRIRRFWFGFSSVNVNSTDSDDSWFGVISVPLDSAESDDSGSESRWHALFALAFSRSIGDLGLLAFTAAFRHFPNNLGAARLLLALAVLRNGVLCSLTIFLK